MRGASEVASRTRYGCREILASQALAALDVEDTQIRVEEGNGRVRERWYPPRIPASNSLPAQGGEGSVKGSSRQGTGAA